MSFLFLVVGISGRGFTVCPRAWGMSFLVRESCVRFLVFSFADGGFFGNRNFRQRFSRSVLDTGRVSWCMRFGFLIADGCDRQIVSDAVPKGWVS